MLYDVLTRDVRTISHRFRHRQNRCTASARSGIGGKATFPDNIPPNSSEVSTDTAFVIKSEQFTRVLMYRGCTLTPAAPGP